MRLLPFLLLAQDVDVEKAKDDPSSLFFEIDTEGTLKMSGKVFYSKENNHAGKLNEFFSARRSKARFIDENKMATYVVFVSTRKGAAVEEVARLLSVASSKGGVTKFVFEIEGLDGEYASWPFHADTSEKITRIHLCCDKEKDFAAHGHDSKTHDSDMRDSKRRGEDISMWLGFQDHKEAKSVTLKTVKQEDYDAMAEQAAKKIGKDNPCILRADSAVPFELILKLRQALAEKGLAKIGLEVLGSPPLEE